MEPIYISRPVLGELADSIRRMATTLGLTLPEDAPHVTLISSSTAVDWQNPAFRTDPEPFEVVPSAMRFDRFGDNIVLVFESAEIQARHAELRAAGASHDFPQYNSHITIGLDVSGSLWMLPDDPYLSGPLTFGPEERKVARPANIIEEEPAL